jgi:hypothetical protein
MDTIILATQAEIELKNYAGKIYHALLEKLWEAVKKGNTNIDLRKLSKYDIYPIRDYHSGKMTGLYKFADYVTLWVGPEIICQGCATSGEKVYPWETKKYGTVYICSECAISLIQQRYKTLEERQQKAREIGLKDSDVELLEYLT